MPSPSPEQKTFRSLYATAPRGVEDLLAGELEALGADEVRPGVAGVHFRGDLEIAYRVCLWSRIASRVLWPLFEFRATTAEQLYDGVVAVRWEEHLDGDGTLAVSARLRDTPFDNSHFVELKTKDAVVDRFRERQGRRPGVDLEAPDLRIYVFAQHHEVTVGIDLAGDPLHRRGYRSRGVTAPLKENLAAAILLRAGWPRLAKQGWALFDPMCGSATLLIEGAMMACDVAPGLDRRRFGFHGWRKHDSALWNRLVSEAEGRRRSLPGDLSIGGSDDSTLAIEAARENIRQAGFSESLSVRCEGLSVATPPTGAGQGLLVTNPPWGHRIGGSGQVAEIYSRLGARLRSAFGGWNAAVLGPDETTLREIGLRWFKVNKLHHGPLPCRLAHYRISPRLDEPIR
jgi:23S rRNA (guanine2445-N2)-methyltransferase / 23S rRNA (guanine2069-N7)-methyltransferase